MEEVKDESEVPRTTHSEHGAWVPLERPEDLREGVVRWVSGSSSEVPNR